MKKSALSIVLAVVFGYSATASTPIDGVKKEVKTDQSKVTWKAYKVTGSHVGTIGLKEGSLLFTEDKLTGGEFVVDMASLAGTDLEGEYKGKLEGHLKSDDFFGVEKNPTASLTFKKVKITGKNSYKITGELTIKGNTETIVFDLSVYGNKANASLKIDRTKYDVRYGSTSFFDNLKDKAIYDEFDLVADLEF